MIKDPRINGIVGSKILACTSALRASNFGINPRSGGRPPRDRRRRMIIGPIFWGLFSGDESEAKVLCEVDRSRLIMVMVIRE